MSFPEILGFDRLTFFVRDLMYWRDWFCTRLGGVVVATQPGQVVLGCGGVTLALTQPFSGSRAGAYLAEHPEGVGDVAFRVEDLAQVRACLSGVELLEEGMDFLTIRGVAEVSHTFRVGTPRVGTTRVGAAQAECGFAGIDHVVINVGSGRMQAVSAWYQRVLGWSVRERYTIAGEASALHSCVLVNATGTVQVPINEPASLNSQVQEFLDYNRGAGVQHVALASRDIFADVSRLQAGGLTFLEAPSDYYRNRPWLSSYGTRLQALGILVDLDPNLPEQRLLQVFTQPIFQEPTFFFEVIQRLGQRVGFGAGNFQALFTAIEREQARRQPVEHFGGDRGC
ncbi:VOC family protein [Anthocerotibacter panamensis]|uniref:VOC family protein n=1 Tax=Anthocerotibacter panamensis TaxID=2857077 RepID=UPI001C402343|nr:VOC family protein [Anthocerotibacter panamensis]